VEKLIQSLFLKRKEINKRKTTEMKQQKNKNNKAKSKQ
jgi:hypothetical protein